MLLPTGPPVAMHGCGSAFERAGPHEVRWQRPHSPQGTRAAPNYRACEWPWWRVMCTVGLHSLVHGAAGAVASAVWGPQLAACKRCVGHTLDENGAW